MNRGGATRDAKRLHSWPLQAAAHRREDEMPHTDDLAVDRFAAAMKAKLAKKRADGRSGWDDPEVCSMKDLKEMLLEHVAYGDVVDIANFCMMISVRRARGRMRKQGKRKGEVK